MRTLKNLRLCFKTTTYNFFSSSSCLSSAGGWFTLWSLFSIIFIPVHSHLYQLMRVLPISVSLYMPFFHASPGLLETHTPLIAKLIFQFFYKLTTYR